MNSEFRRNTRATVMALAALMLMTGWAWGAQKAKTTPRSAAASAGEQFFIVASIDLKACQVVLKLPTEVTELLRITPKTEILNEEGKPMTLKDLRAGDTVYVIQRKEDSGPPVALRIRIGRMTVEELYKRYLGSSGF